MTPAELSLWLRTAPAENASALDDLVTSGDLEIMTDVDQFTTRRSHNRELTRFEIGPLPPLAIRQQQFWHRACRD
jgi:hypothetical protein